jgi:selenocysteine lyase/cysteine desulfurase
MMQTAIQQILDWKVNNIQTYCQQLLKQVLERLQQNGIRIEPPEHRAHHLVGLRLPEHIQMESLKERLIAHNVHVSYRGNAIRLSCHLYNDHNDVVRLMEAFDH